MNRRSLAIGATIALPAGVAAFYASAATPPASAPPRQRRARRDADKPIREVHRIYRTAREEEARICAEPGHPAFSAEDLAQNAALEKVLWRSGDAVAEAAKLPAISLEGLQLKAAILKDALEQAADIVLDTDSPQVRLAASVAADIVRLTPAEGGQA